MKTKKHKAPNPRVGSSFDAWLIQEMSDPEFTSAFKAKTAQLHLGRRLKEIAQGKRLSVRKLADRMRTSPSQVQRILSDEAVKCSVETLVKFAIATDTNLSEFFLKEGA